MKLYGFLLAVLTAVAVTACGSSEKWSVGGTIEGAEGKLLTLERSYNGSWTVLDSVRLAGDGKYKFESQPVGYPDIYRVTIDGTASAYFPIDSIENVTLSGNMSGFATGYELGGSDQAEMMQNVNKMINAKVETLGRDAVNDSTLKQELANIVLGDMGSIVSYYVINKEIGGKRIFDPANKRDLRVIGAVVNAFSSTRPNDPRTRIMEQQYLAQRRALKSTTTSVEAIEIGFPEIALKDVNGNEQSLTALAGKGRPVILNFTAYAAENSPAINVALASIYEQGGVDIYQVSIDGDDALWRDAARNIPWTAVHNTPRDGDRVLVEYNVSVIPQTFIIDKNGRLQERVDDITNLFELVKKYK